MFEHLSPSEWLLYISEWNDGTQQASNIRVTTKVAVNALLHSDQRVSLPLFIWHCIAQVLLTSWKIVHCSLFHTIKPNQSTLGKNIGNQPANMLF